MSININEIFTLIDVSGGNIDFTTDVMDGNNEYSIELGNTIIVKFNKPFNRLFINSKPFEDGSTITSMTLSRQTNDGEKEFKTLDLTSLLKKNGFIYILDDLSSWVKVNDLYELKIKLTGTGSKKLNFIGNIFTDDNDLLSFEPTITNKIFLSNNKTDHLSYHIDARDQIIQYLRNKGIRTDKNTLTSFDVLKQCEVKLACTYLTLAQIYLHLSTNDDNKYSYKHDEYRKLYNGAVQFLDLNIDTDGDGLPDEEPKRVGTVKSIRIIR